MQTPSENKIRFDKTVNLGHILTMCMFLVAMMTGWNMMDKRLLVLEEARTSQRDRDALQDSTAKDNQQAIKEALTDLRRSVEKVADKVGAQK
jgi:hypothetical protein